MLARRSGGRVKRREFITLVGGTAVALSVAARAQQPAKQVIGFLRAGEPPKTFVEAFRQGLRERGYVEGQNVVIEFRYAGGLTERLPNLAAELVQLKVDVIVV